MMEDDRDVRLVIRLSTSDLELPLDISRKIREEAARLGTTPELLVTQTLWAKIRQMEEAMEAAAQNSSQAQDIQGDTRA